MRRTDSFFEARDRLPHRFYRLHRQWYFFTREGDRGPFSNREDAQRNCDKYKETMTYLEGKRDSLPENVDLADVTFVEVRQLQPAASRKAG